MSGSEPLYPIQMPLGAATSGFGFQPEGTRDGDDPPSLSDSWLYLDRELGELETNYRLLCEAADDRNDVAKRVRLLGRVSTNVDRFFVEQIGRLERRSDDALAGLTGDDRSPGERLTAAREKARRLLEDRASRYHEDVRPVLADAGVHLLRYEDLTATERARVREYFETSVLPTLTPLCPRAAGSTTFASNPSLSVAVLTDDGDEVGLSHVEIPENRPSLVRTDAPGAQLDDGLDGEMVRLVPLARVVEANLDLVFPNLDVVDTATFRVTRAAKPGPFGAVDFDATDRLNGIVRLEIESGASERVDGALRDHLGVSDDFVFCYRPPLDFEPFLRLADLDPLQPTPGAESTPRPWTPRPHPRFSGIARDDPGGVFAEIADRDVFVHRPYHSFRSTVGRFLDAAAADPDVLAVKTVVDPDPRTEVVDGLVSAAEAGKQVAVVLGSRSCADEQCQTEWIDRLEDAGAYVARESGDPTGARTALVVRESDDDVDLYSYVATGGSAADSDATRADVGLFTADPAIGRDLVELFNRFTGGSTPGDFRKLVVAPGKMRSRLVDLIDRERAAAGRGEEGRIVAKMNALEDPELIRRLYRASQAGVEIDLIVRGVCRLRPQIKGVSGNVRVHSVVGRFREHSRLFWFHNGGDHEYYIGSADWTPVDVDRRVEAMVPVEDPEVRTEIDAVIEAMLADNRRRWVLRANGSYEQVEPAVGVPARSAHQRLMNRATEGATAPSDRQ